MKILIFPIFMFLCTPVFSQSFFGKWKSIDDETGEAKSIVEIYQKGESLEGRIISLINPPPDDPDPVCSECPEDDERYMEKVIGMVIIRDIPPSRAAPCEAISPNYRRGASDSASGKKSAVLSTFTEATPIDLARPFRRQQGSCRLTLNTTS